LPSGHTCNKSTLDGADCPGGTTLLAAQVHEAGSTVLIQQSVHTLAARAQDVPAASQRRRAVLKIKKIMDDADFARSK